MRALDLFCGACGGWSLGLHRAGYRTVAAAEADPWRRAAFLHNFPGVEMFDDVRAVTADALRRRLGYLPEIVVGSPPCQDASSANHRGKGVDGERTGLFFEWVRIVGEVQPVWACAENVPGIRTRGIDRVLTALEAVGYACEPLVVGAVHAGANHRRNRVWIVAYPNAIGWRARTSREHRQEACDGHTEHAADAIGLQLRQQPGWSGGPNGAGAAKPAEHGAQRLAADPVGACRGTIEPAERWSWRQGDDGRTGDAWDIWNGGWAARSRELDDGLPRGLARDCLAAYGDAVVPAIPEAIGRVMSALYEELSR